MNKISHQSEVNNFFPKHLAYILNSEYGAQILICTSFYKDDLHFVKKKGQK